MKHFEELFAVNVNGHTEKKKVDERTELTYLSWPFAWAEVKKRFPDAQYEIEKFNGLPYVCDPLTGYMVYTSVTIEGIRHEMWLPVMDGKNKAMKMEPYTYMVRSYDRSKKAYTTTEKRVEAATMMDINKTIMRCLVKNLAMFGLGLYIYAGEDLPLSTDEKTSEEEKPLSEALRASQAYPERADMEKTLTAAVSADHMAKWCEMWGVRSLSEATDPQIMGMYAHYEKKGAIK